MLNECFLKYKNKHKGERGLLFGSGKSIENYKPIDGVKVGTGKMIYSNIPMDYLFVGDPAKGQPKTFSADKESYRNYKCKKFYRGKSNFYICNMPENEDATYYKVSQRLNRPEGKLYKDITKDMGAGVSIIFEALQFILYTGISELYIIGCDCQIDKETYNVSNDILKMLLRMWDKAKVFIENEYDIPVKVINQKGLKIFEGVTYNEIGKRSNNKLQRQKKSTKSDTIGTKSDMEKHKGYSSGRWERQEDQGDIQSI